MNNSVNDNDVRSLYEKSVQDRNFIRFVLGAFVRWKQNLKYSRIRKIARKNGATIGQEVVMPSSLARRANKNLTVGSHTSIQTDKIDMRSPVTIGNYVIIGKDTEILTTSHNIDSQEWEHKSYGIIIEDYAWLPTRVMILPSCRKIGYGAVVSSGSVVVKDIEKMSVVGGNPAVEFKKRKCVHSKLVVESLLGGDYKAYVKTRNNKQKL
ncbi:acyltransferase [Phocaeicola barnesiae]|uniref:acyltransferase n=1 Tax=Phocaeicola barnesiae TaxID=376804 RepID=UPI00241F6327|nr:acyltransferase [Phocaeicola barnesiae]